MTLLLFISMLAVTNVYLVMLIIHETHMFQQNSYIYSRYLRWFLRNNDKRVLKKGIIGIFAAPVIWLGYDNIAYICLIAYYLLMIFLHERKPEKKKLVYTGRIKRLFTVISILLLLNLLYITAAYYDAFVKMEIYTAIHVVLLSLPQLIIILAAALIAPLENFLSFFYIADARKMIRRHQKLIVVGITGSSGKTSTKNILNELLRLKYNTLITPESYNTTMGVVRTIREQLGPLHEVFIVEMGAKKRHDIEEICNVVYPLYGIITCIGQQHLETFKSTDNIIKTKFELFNAIPSYGAVFINKDDENISSNFPEGSKRHISYSMRTANCDYYLHNVMSGSNGMKFTVTAADGGSQDFHTELLGKHNLYNILSAISCSCTLGMTLNETAGPVRGLKPVPHRLELKKTDPSTYVIDDSYNSNPEGAKEALEVLGSFRDSKRILITPGMVELGEKQEYFNRNFGRQAAENCDYIILVGRKQTLPIYEGLAEAGFDMGKCHTAADLNEAVKKLNEVKSEKNTVLFENDLPDIYNG